MATKYVGDRGAERYVENTANRAPQGLTAAARVSSWRMPVEGELAMGIWGTATTSPRRNSDFTFNKAETISWIVVQLYID